MYWLHGGGPSIQTPILNRFGRMHGGDLFLCLKVGDGAGDLDIFYGRLGRRSDSMLYSPPLPPTRKKPA